MIIDTFIKSLYDCTTLDELTGAYRTIMNIADASNMPNEVRYTLQVVYTKQNEKIFFNPELCQAKLN